MARRTRSSPVRRGGEGALPGPLARAKARLEKWRRTRRGRRIPEGLWAEAAKLAERYGVHRTATSLRLNGTTLKKRLSATPAEREEVPQFVELLPLGGDQGWADLTDARGGRVRVEWRGRAPDLAALSRSFFGAAS